MVFQLPDKMKYPVSKKLVLICLLPGILVIMTVFSGFGIGREGHKDVPEIIQVYKIWDFAPHNAFTDLVLFKRRWFCTFREGETHVYGENGKIRIISSKNGHNWESFALLEEAGFDLRDPKLSVTPDGRLMLVAGGSVYNDKVYVTRRPRVAFSSDGKTWTGMIPVLNPGDWLWRVTWFRGTAYGTSYNNSDPDWKLHLYKSVDGINYQMITELEIDGQPNETTLRFLSNGEMIALVRREGGSKNAMAGHSLPPYTVWNWKETGYRAGGPNFIVINDDNIWAAGRNYNDPKKTVLATFNNSNYQPVIELPSGGDNSYPGMVWYKKILWVSYYSSHEGKTSIYLAKIRL